MEPSSPSRRGEKPLSATESYHRDVSPERGASAYVLVIHGTTSARRALPRNGVVVLGRAPESDIRVEAASISRKHARLIVSDGVAEVADLGSHNGTQVNGEPVVGARRLLSGDVITAGEATLLFRQEGPSSGRAPLGAAALRQRLADEIERALDHGRTISVLLAHLDEPLSADDVTARVLPVVAGSDPFGWLSALELLMLLPERSPDAARSAGRQAAKALAEIAPGARLGLASCPAEGCDAETLLVGARAAAKAARSLEVRAASDAVVEHVLGEHRVVLADPAMIQIFDLIRRLAPSDLAVLILGETGVGKEHAAMALHHGSRRAGKPLVTLNCAALPDALVESELFGHEPGAFSDARTAKPGLLEKANGGTVFLDEVGELSERVQAKLLRALEAKRITRLGDLRERDVDVRVIAATNRDLEAEVREKRFRDDLFYRLSTATVHLLPLRERPRDVPVLARRFLSASRERLSRPPVELSEAAMERLATHRWPGNVRELRNAMEFAAATMTGDRVEVWDLPERIRRPSEGEIEADEPAPPEPLPESDGRVPLAEELRRLERARIAEALEVGRGVKLRAAELLGMPIRTLDYKLKQYGLSPKSPRRRP